MAEPQDNPKQAGFELQGEFIPWHLTDKIRDLQLIDFFAKIPPAEFFAAVKDDFDRSRSPITAAMIATSIAHHKPGWSSNRVIRFVEDINMHEVTFFDGEDEEEKKQETESPLATGETSDDDADTPESSEKLSEQPDIE